MHESQEITQADLWEALNQFSEQLSLYRAERAELIASWSQPTTSLGIEVPPSIPATNTPLLEEVDPLSIPSTSSLFPISHNPSSLSDNEVDEEIVVESPTIFELNDVLPNVSSSCGLNTHMPCDVSTSLYDHSLDSRLDTHAIDDVGDELVSSSTCASNVFAPSSACKSDDSIDALTLQANHNLSATIVEFDVPILEPSMNAFTFILDHAFQDFKHIPHDSLDMLASMPFNDPMLLLDEIKHVPISPFPILSCDLPPDLGELVDNNISSGLVALAPNVVFDSVEPILADHFDLPLPSVPCSKALVDFLGCEKYLLPHVPTSSLLTTHTLQCHMTSCAPCHGFKYYDSCGILGVGIRVCLSLPLQGHTLSPPYLLEPLPIAPEPPPFHHEHTLPVALAKHQFLIRDENFCYKRIKRFRPKVVSFFTLLFCIYFYFLSLIVCKE